MSLRFAVCVLLPASLVLGACGGSSHSSSSGATTSSSSSASASTSTGSMTASASTTSSAGKPKHFATGSSNVRVPATFAVLSDGTLDPPEVSIPAKLTVLVTVISKDGTGHRVVVEVPAQKSFSVPANGRASVLIPPLRVGHYPIQLDGKIRGLLVTGAQPGP